MGDTPTLQDAAQAVTEIGPGCDGKCPPRCKHEDAINTLAKALRDHHDLSKARLLIPAPRHDDLAQRPKRGAMAPLLQAMLDEAVTMACATGSIGGSQHDSAGGYEFAVSFHVRRKDRIHEVCALSPATACPLCKDDIRFPRRKA